MAGELRQRLAAEARAAGAEKHHVGRARRAAARRGLRMAARSSRCAGSRSSGSVAVGVARAQPVERALAARQRVVEGIRRRRLAAPMRSVACVVDGLDRRAWRESCD